MGRKMNFDIRNGEEQRKHLRKLMKRDHLCLGSNVLFHVLVIEFIFLNIPGVNKNSSVRNFARIHWSFLCMDAQMISHM